MQEKKLLITAREAAKLLSISERTLWAWTNNGNLPVTKIGRVVRYSVQEIERFVIEQSRKKITGSI